MPNGQAGAEAAQQSLKYTGRAKAIRRTQKDPFLQQFEEARGAPDTGAAQALARRQFQQSAQQALGPALRGLERAGIRTSGVGATHPIFGQIQQEAGRLELGLAEQQRAEEAQRAREIFGAQRQVFGSEQQALQQAKMLRAQLAMQQYQAQLGAETPSFGEQVMGGIAGGLGAGIGQTAGRIPGSVLGGATGGFL